MINLIGTEYNAKWLSLPVAQTYWYGKDVLPGRKVGHINAITAHPSEIPFLEECFEKYHQQWQQELRTLKRKQPS